MSAAREARPPDDHPITWPKVWLGHLLILIGEIEERAAAMPLEDAVADAVLGLGHDPQHRVVDYALAYGFGLFRVGRDMFLSPEMFRQYAGPSHERGIGHHLTKLALARAKAADALNDGVLPDANSTS